MIVRTVKCIGIPGTPVKIDWDSQPSIGPTKTRNMAAEQLVQTCIRLHCVRKAHKDAAAEVTLLTQQEYSVTGAVAGLQFQECSKLSRRLEAAQLCSTFFEETLPSKLIQAVNVETDVDWAWVDRTSVRRDPVAYLKGPGTMDRLLHTWRNKTTLSVNFALPLLQNPQSGVWTYKPVVAACEETRSLKVMKALHELGVGSLVPGLPSVAATTWTCALSVDQYIEIVRVLRAKTDELSASIGATFSAMLDAALHARGDLGVRKAAAAARRDELAAEIEELVARVRAAKAALNIPADTDIEGMVTAQDDGSDGFSVVSDMP